MSDSADAQLAAALSTPDDAIAQAASDSAALDSDQYDAQQELIKSEQANRPLIGELEPFSALESEYNNNAKFRNKIAAASRKEYPRFRRVRGDGNCFYRAYLFGILDWMSKTLRNPSPDATDKADLERLLKTLKDSLAVLVSQGFEEFTMEMFYETFLELFEWVEKEKPDSETLMKKCCEEEADMYNISYARYLTSSFLESHKEEYAPYVTDGKNVAEFRRTEIEPMNRECEHLHIVCLTNLLQIGVRIAYLDQSQSQGGAASNSASSEEALQTYDFPHGSKIRVHLLYRPGHYDILQPGDSSSSSSTTVQ